MNNRDRIHQHRLSTAVVCVGLAMGLTFCSSCSTPPAADDGIVGIIYNAAVRPDTGHMVGKPMVTQPTPAVAVQGTVTPDSPVTTSSPASGSSTNSSLEGQYCYRISPGDVLAISYFAHPLIDLKEYLIDSQDVLTITVAGQDARTADVVVRPDGNISFYLIGDVSARGLSVSQVREEITKRMAKFMPAAEVTVMLKVANALTSEFLNTLRSNTDLGATRIIQVRSDGTVTFPLVGEVRAMGKTLPELSREVEKKYDLLFRRGISVSLNLNSSSVGNIAVLGEVQNPGRYTISSPVSPFFALAMAGGAKETGRKSQVVVVSRRPDGKVGWTVVNLDIDSGQPLGPEIALAPQDMLLVPKTGVYSLNLFVEQYIRRMMPVNTSMGFGYNLNHVF
ncbi:MAG: polysaccharide biosynthesis/export family protein [bacterium]